MALKDHFGESGRSLWDQWSKSSTKHDEREQDRAWRSFVGGKGITIGTLFHYAKQAGWESRKQSSKETKGSAAKGSGRDTSGANHKHWREGMISARDLCSMRFAPLKFIVPRVIPEGLTILAGRPKIGKSWLTLLIGIVFANGGAALGLDYGATMPLRGSVLYLGLEDGRRRLQRRMTKLLGAQPENWPAQLYLKTDWRRFDQGGLDDIRAWYEDAKAKGETPTLAIVDTLAKVRAPGNPKASPYQNDHDALAGLQKLADELGIAVVVNHHDRKMDADDVFDTVSGTLGLTGAVDTILVLTKKAQGTTLHIRGRDIEDENPLALQFNNGRWSVLGSASEVQRSDERTRIIKILADAADGLSVAEIMAGANLRSRSAADFLLFKLAEAGDIERVKRGLYGMPGTRARMAAAAEAKAAAKIERGRKIAKKLRSTPNNSENQGDSNLSGNLSDSEPAKIVSPNLSDLSGADGGTKIGAKVPKSLNEQGNGSDLSDLSDLSGTSDLTIPPSLDRRGEPPRAVTCRVTIREIRPPGLGPPGDDLNDFVR
jgi:hypothetical protein